jgi:hypothetical protein
VAITTTPTHVTDRHRTDLPNPILPEFWVRPAEDIDADLAVLRAEGPTRTSPSPRSPRASRCPRARAPGP